MASLQPLPSPLASGTKTCVNLFERLNKLLLQLDERYAGIVPNTETADSLGRFRIWAGNIGAFQRFESKSSLDYRLRDARKIAVQIVGLLEGLAESLEDACSIVSNERTNRTGSAPEIDQVGSEDDNNDKPDEDREELSEIKEILSSITDTINSLFRFSIIIRNNTNRDRYAKATAAALDDPIQDLFDISHVREKFPALKAKGKVWLITRLGKAITQRRQYLKYCREHHHKISAQSTSGNSLSVPKTAELTSMQPVAKAHTLSGMSALSKPTSTLAPTQASTLVLKSEETVEEETAEESQSQTSYATSNEEDASSSVLHVVKLDDVSKGLSHFECPYCWQIQACTTQRTWKKHALSDLKPYVCTYEDCDLKMFSDRHTWFSHELKDHRREWYCHFCTRQPFDSIAKYEAHLNNRHSQSFTSDQLPALLEISQRPVVKVSPADCPFCDDWGQRLRAINPHIPLTDTLVVTQVQFKHHVGSHMEQLALFAIPRGYTERGDADSGNAALGSDLDLPSSHDGNIVSTSKTAEQLRLCEDILAEMMDAGPIAEPFTTSTGTGPFAYLRRNIPEPWCDLSSISQKLSIGQYLGPKDLKKDVDNMFAEIYKLSGGYAINPRDDELKLLEFMTLFESLWNANNLPQPKQQTSEATAGPSSLPLSPADDDIPECVTTAELRFTVNPASDRDNSALRVLVCEETPGRLQDLRATLDKLGSQYTRISTTYVGLGARPVLDSKFDIIFLDFLSIGVSGNDIVQNIRESVNINTDSPIVAVTQPHYAFSRLEYLYLDGVINPSLTESKVLDVLKRLALRVQSLLKSMASDPSKALSNAFQHLESLAEWWRSSNQFPLLDDDTAHQRLSRRVRDMISNKSSHNINLVIRIAAMHIEHEVLNRIYINGQTMTRKPVADIQRDNFLATEDGYAWDMVELSEAIAHSGSLRNPITIEYFTPNDIQVILNHPLGVHLKSKLEAKPQSPGYVSLQSRIGERASREPGPPPSTRGFDRIQPKGGAWEQPAGGRMPAVPPPPPMDPIQRLARDGSPPRTGDGPDGEVFGARRSSPDARAESQPQDSQERGSMSPQSEIQERISTWNEATDEERGAKGKETMREPLDLDSEAASTASPSDSPSFGTRKDLKEDNTTIGPSATATGRKPQGLLSKSGIFAATTEHASPTEAAETLFRDMKQSSDDNANSPRLETLREPNSGEQVARPRSGSEGAFNRPRLSTSEISNTRKPLTTTYKIVADPPIERSRVSKDGKPVRPRSPLHNPYRSNRKEYDIIPTVTTTYKRDPIERRRASKDVISGKRRRPPSRLLNSYRSDDEEYYAIPASSRRGHQQEKGYDSSIDNAALNKVSKEGGEPRAVRHPDTIADDYGDNGYGYTNPMDLVRYDLDLKPRDRLRRNSAGERPAPTPEFPRTATKRLERLARPVDDPDEKALEEQISGGESPLTTGLALAGAAIGLNINEHRTATEESGLKSISRPPREKFPQDEASRVLTDEKPVKSILRPPRSKFPEDSNPIREGVAPLEDAEKEGIPPDARWTKISSNLVSPEALEAGKERYEAREDFVIVLRVLSREEVQGYADFTERIRAAREELDRQERRRLRRERSEPRYRRYRDPYIESESDTTEDSYEGEQDRPKIIDPAEQIMRGGLGEVPSMGNNLRENPNVPGQYIGYVRNPPPLAPPRKRGTELRAPGGGFP